MLKNGPVFLKEVTNRFNTHKCNQDTQTISDDGLTLTQTKLSRLSSMAQASMCCGYEEINEFYFKVISLGKNGSINAYFGIGCEEKVDFKYSFSD